jgi:proteic killer suppression protein
MAFEVSHSDDSLERLERDASYTAGFDPAIVKAFRKRMWSIRNATDERDLRGLKSARFEKLSGDGKGQYSMRLNDQWRLIVEFEGEAPNKRITILEIADYH